MFMDYVLVVYAWWWSFLRLFHHVVVDGVVVGCDRHNFMLVMHLLCMLVYIRCYAFIFMVIVVVHEVIVGILVHQDVVDML